MAAIGLWLGTIFCHLLDLMVMIYVFGSEMYFSLNKIEFLDLNLVLSMKFCLELKIFYYEMCTIALCELTILYFG